MRAIDAICVADNMKCKGKDLKNFAQAMEEYVKNYFPKDFFCGIQKLQV